METVRKGSETAEEVHSAYVKSRKTVQEKLREG